MKKVSIIIPIFGVEKYIERCVRSLFEQTLKGIEYIFIDDCTPDNSIDILLRIIEEYKKRLDSDEKTIQLLRMPVNSGQAAVRKHGIMHANGKYIIHCDPDDWVDHTIYEKLYNAAIKENADIVYCDFYLSDGTHSESYSQVKNKGLLQGPLWNRLVKTDLYIKNEIIFPIANKAEDSALMMQLSYYSNKIIYYPEPLYYYYCNPKSICRVQSEDAYIKRFKEEIQNTDLVIDFLKKHNAESKYKADIIKRKSFARDTIYPLVHKKKYYKLWFSTYKEINIQYIVCKDISLKNKLGFIKRILCL